ncbi:DUF4124 domain-containing protein [Ketobacter sp. MCCC 1A13808]|uniref:DUF4124 domain-containing protein n=1 Tax=Ketobacter sp. MCCC 1A13808 TaxID=2602738 RepID=UPI0012EB66CB|nr:DUF4124 domain-containing protein [Ketobacter sp. MCCC 1A13808]MVF13866.1 DUF4124 domain-containing protein [Ketobacter sp. MCCC 1A13808]
MRFTPTLLAAVMVISFSAQAETVYKYTDKDGNTVFTDEPTKGAEKMDVKPVATVPAIPVPKNTPEESQEKTAFEYKDIKITSPQPDENFINNGGKATVSVSLDPSLRAGDTIQLYFNGIPKSEPVRSTYFPFDNLARGSYAVTATVRDKDENVVGKSDTLTFYIRRSAIPQKK